MKGRVSRRAVDLSAYPDLVVIYLGMRVNALKGVKTLLRFGREIRDAVNEKPDGLLLHETIFYSLRNIGMRQYWRDFDALETWARSLPHQEWWREFLSDSGRTGFWHETYFMRGGMEAIYDDMEAPVGFMHFAPLKEARGPVFSARTRLRLQGESKIAVPLTEDDLYGRDEAEIGVRRVPSP